MKFSAVTLLAMAMVMFTTSCTNTGPGGDHPVGTGPFDRRGNYIEAWADNPAKWRGGDRKPTPTRTATPRPTRPTATASTQQARPTQTAQNRPAATARPQPRPTPKPQVRRYTVKRGDTLSAIARRHKTTVAGLRRANGISGDLIRPGQVLRIP